MTRMDMPPSGTNPGYRTRSRRRGVVERGGVQDRVPSTSILASEFEDAGSRAVPSRGAPIPDPAMKAIVQERYGPPEEVLHLRDVDTPVPADEEVLVRVRATSVHPDVWHMVHGRPYILRLGGGMFGPRNPTPGTDVAGVDSGEKLDVVRSIGADRVIDYRRDDFTRSGERYDLVFDVPGNHQFSEVRRALTPRGTYVLIGHDGFGRSAGRWLGSLRRFLKLMVLSPFAEQLPPPDFSSPNKRDAMALLKDLLEARKLTPVLDRTFPLSEVPAAIRYLEEGRVRGRIVITV